MPRKLYYSGRSPYARKVRIVLAEKQLPYEVGCYHDQLHQRPSLQETLAKA